MADGYIDPATGQYVPGSFADQLDLPGPTGGSQADIDAANAALKKEQGKGRADSLNIATATKKRQALLKQLNSTKGVAAQAKIRAQIQFQEKYIAAQTKARQASITAQVPLQNKVYEATGQYDKLLTGANRDAYAALKSLFNGYGLGSLAPKIYEYAKQGYGADTISLLLQDTPEYKERFAANQDRIKKGLPVLSPAEYLATEQSYRQIMQDAGLPKGFYDNVADFRQFISNDTSPTEIKGRVDLAVGNTTQAPAWVTNALQQMYGVDKSYITAYFLDQSKALPLLQKQAQAAQFGAEALKRGLTLDKGDLEDFVTAGLNLGAVSSGFQAVAEALPNIQAIAARYGETIDQHELEQDLVGGFTSSTGDTKRKRLASQERALFSGTGGASSQGLGPGYAAT